MGIGGQWMELLEHLQSLCEIQNWKHGRMLLCLWLHGSVCAVSDWLHWSACTVSDCGYTGVHAPSVTVVTLECGCLFISGWLSGWSVTWKVSRDSSLPRDQIREVSQSQLPEGWILSDGLGFCFYLKALFVLDPSLGFWACIIPCFY